MKQKRIAECKCNSLAPYSGKEANGKIEYGKNLMKHREIYLAVSIGCLLMAAIYSQIESHFLFNTNPFFYETMYIFDLLETEIFMDTKRKKKANPDSLEKNEELVTAETDQTPEQNQEEIAAKVARKLNRIPFYPKDWKDSFGLSVEEHKKALETNLTDGYIEFSATR